MLAAKLTISRNPERSWEAPRRSVVKVSQVSKGTAAADKKKIQSTRLASSQRLGPSRQSDIIDLNRGKDRERGGHRGDDGAADFVAARSRVRRAGGDKMGTVRGTTHATATLISGMPVRTSSLVMLRRV
jgi:hypothetical protein